MLSMDIKFILLLLSSTVKHIKTQSTNDGVCSTESDSGNVQCALQNIQNTLESQASFMRDLHQMILSQSMKDCTDLFNQKHTSTGVYMIHPPYFRRTRGTESTPVYCDMETDGGGWTVFQRRIDGSEDFHRDWNDYRDGFGDVSAEHWLGNTILYLLTTLYESYTLRIDLSDWDGESRHAVYSFFRVASEAENFKLQFDDYLESKSNAGDSLSFHNGMEFSTRDRDNDLGENSCASDLGPRGGFWYNACQRAGLNNQYAGSASDYNGYAGNRIRWDAWHGNSYSLKTVKMMIRPSN